MRRSSSRTAATTTTAATPAPRSYERRALCALAWGLVLLGVLAWLAPAPQEPGARAYEDAKRTVQPPLSSARRLGLLVRDVQIATDDFCRALGYTQRDNDRVGD